MAGISTPSRKYKVQSTKYKVTRSKKHNAHLQGVWRIGISMPPFRNFQKDWSARSSSLQRVYYVDVYYMDVYYVDVYYVDVYYVDVYYVDVYYVDKLCCTLYFARYT